MAVASFKNPLQAPEELMNMMREAHPNLTIPLTRLEQLGAVKAIDLAMKVVINSVKKLERETIFIFHSDNGGAVKAYGGASEDGPR